MYQVYTEKIAQILYDTQFSKKMKEIQPEQCFESVATILNHVHQRNQFIFLFGNGASCSIADHFTADFAKNAQIKTLSMNSSLYSAFSNDDSFEKTLSNFIACYASDIGFAIGISSSGESPNMIQAFKQLQQSNITSLSLTGKSSTNTCRQLSTFSIYCPSSYYGEVESAHACIMHYLIDLYLDTYKNGRI